VKIEREQHTCDGGTTWTFELVLFGRSLKVQWYGPTHAYHPDTPIATERWAMSKTDAQILADAIESWPDHPWLPGATITPELREVIARYHGIASGYAADVHGDHFPETQL